MRACYVDGCNNIRNYKLYCSMHQTQIIVHGKITNILPQNRGVRIMYKGVEFKPGSHPLYQTWNSMRQRCYNPKTRSYSSHGSRGVKMCDRWLGASGFANFCTDMGEKPPGTSIDRIDNDGDYEPKNCRWATPKEQANNRSTNRYVTFNGETHNITEWAEITGIGYRTLFYRINHLGWSTERALTTILDK